MNCGAFITYFWTLTMVYTAVPQTGVLPRWATSWSPDARATASNRPQPPPVPSVDRPDRRRHPRARAGSCRVGIAIGGLAR